MEKTAEQLIHVKLPRDLYKRVKLRAVRDDTTVKALVIEAVERLLTRKEG